MSCFKNSRFAKELAYRTMVNCYLLRVHVLETDVLLFPELQRVLHKYLCNGSPRAFNNGRSLDQQIS